MAELEQRSEAWFAARRGKLTASNLGAALGLVSYTSRQEAFRRMLGTSEFVGNDATRWGTEKEPDAIAEYERITGIAVNATGLHTHPEYPWLAGSPDGLCGLRGMIEVKCPYYYRRDGTRVHSEIPTHYYCQMNALMEICDRDWCDFVSWSPESMRIMRVFRDSDTFHHLLPHYREFHARMEAGESTPNKLSKSSKDLIIEVVTAAAASADRVMWEYAILSSSEGRRSAETEEEAGIWIPDDNF